MMDASDREESALELWDIAVQASILTGIRVRWIPEEAGLSAEELAGMGEPLDTRAFLSGHIRPSGAVILFESTEGQNAFWELSPRCSELFRAAERQSGPAPGELASLRVQ